MQVIQCKRFPVTSWIRRDVVEKLAYYVGVIIFQMNSGFPFYSIFWLWQYVGEHWRVSLLVVGSWKKAGLCSGPPLPHNHTHF